MLRSLAAFAILTTATFAADLVIESPATRVHLIELYTSEGCSSCPPADAWLRGLKTQRGLWREFVPVCFHVTYWDDLGWPDKFASPRFTQRQREYAAAWGAGTVYTPGFVLDGREWRGRELPAAAKEKAGVLRASVSARAVSVSYERAGLAGKRLAAQLVWLGGGVESDVKAGENRGRKLQHEFVALSIESRPLAPSADAFTATFSGPRPDKALAVAVWIVESGKHDPLQAAGGWLAAP